MSNNIKPFTLYPISMKTKLLLLSALLTGTLCAWAQTPVTEVNEECGTVVEISATADPGYEFDSWQDGNTDNPRQIVIDADSAVWLYVASFRPKTMTVYGLSNDDMMGAVTGATNGEVGTTMDLTAVPANGCYRFKEWSDGVQTATRTITVGVSDADNTYTAVFEPVQFNLKVNAGDHGSVQITTL